MADIVQNTRYLTTPATYVARDHLTLQVEVPVYPTDLPPEERQRDRATDWRRVSIPIHHLESVCVCEANSISPPALDLCWEQGVAVNYLTENGYLQARVPAADIIANGRNLTLASLGLVEPEKTDHPEPEAILASVAEKERRILTIVAEMRRLVASEE